MNTSTQHGRQLPQQHTASPTDPRTRNNSRPTTHTSDSSGDICKDFIWGICALGTQCIYRHELEFEAMKSVLKFCHDHQNKTGCTRPNCTYLHTSREEQNLFLATGQIPRVLIDRYKGFSNSLTPIVSEDITSAPPQPQHTMYEYITQPPPPPPPPPTPATVGPTLHHSPHNMQAPVLRPLAGPMQVVMTNSLQGPIASPMQGPNASPMLAPMQGPMHGPAPMPAPMPTPMPPIPPPPPPPPPTSSVSTTMMAGPIYTAPLPVQHNMPPVYNTVSQTAVSQNRPVLPLFDPTRPPPPIPQTTPNRVTKRSPDDIEAGPSKVRKVDSSNDTSCACCVRRLIRIEQTSHQIEKVEQEAEQARSEVALKIASYEKKKQLLRYIFARPETYRRAEDFVEDGPVSPFGSRNELFNSSLFSNPVSTPVNNNSNVLQQMMDLLVGNSARSLIDPMPSPSISDDPVDLLTRTRTNKSTPDLLTNILDLLKKLPSSASSESEPASASGGAAGNGFGRLLGASPPPAARPAWPPLALGAGDAPAPPRLLEAPRYPPPPRHFPPPPPPAPAADAAAPPRALYAHAHYPPNNVAIPPYPGAGHGQPPRPPMPPPAAQTSPYFMGGGYPSQHYYPPYQ